MAEHLSTRPAPAARPQTSNFDACAHATIFSPSSRATVWAAESPTRSTSLPLLEDLDSQLFDRSTFGYPRDGLDRVFREHQWCATAGYAGRDASNHPGPQPGDASRHHAPSQYACQTQPQLAQAAPVLSLNPADLGLQNNLTYYPVNSGPLYDATVPYYAGQILPGVATNVNNLVHHASLPTGMGRMGTILNPTRNFPRHLTRPTSPPAAVSAVPAPALPVRFGYVSLFPLPTIRHVADFQWI